MDIAWTLQPGILVTRCFTKGKHFIDTQKIVFGFQSLPHFGPYKEEREKLIHEARLKGDPALAPEPPKPRNNLTPAKALTLNDVIGKACDRIGAYKQLDPKQQVVALVDEDMCINCGKCYMACNDSGYQAIRFDAETHLPRVTDDCTGCTLCVSVCPIIDCIT